MDIIALDFDGVLCDSAFECATTAWRAGAEFWPEWQGAEPPQVYTERFVALRPVIETGYQTILLMRLVVSAYGDHEIQERFGALCDELLRTLGLSKAELVGRFGAMRDRWIAADTADWLARHRFYPGTIEAVQRQLANGNPVYILTTKQERFTVALLEAAGVALPRERIFGLESGRSKESVLRELLAAPAYAGQPVHFVEDRLDTLLRAVADPCLDPVRLYLATWGYNTERERAAAAAQPRIALWNRAAFLDFGK